MAIKPKAVLMSFVALCFAVLGYCRNTTSQPTETDVGISEAPTEESAATPNESEPLDTWGDAVNKAVAAGEAAQTANNPGQWAAVAALWGEAIELMQAVPESSENYEAAQQKATEYQPNLEYAQENSSAPLSAEDYHLQGSNRYIENDFSGALIAFDKAIEIKPDYAQAYWNRGLTLLRLDNKSGAIEDLEKAIELYESQGDVNGASQVRDRLTDIKLNE